MLAYKFYYACRYLSQTPIYYFFRILLHILYVDKLLNTKVVVEDTIDSHIFPLSSN